MTEPLLLDGSGLSIEDVRSVARDGRQVAIASAAIGRVQAARQVIYELAAENTPIYGFNRGVGINKDKVITAERFEAYNRNLLLSHCGGVGPEASEEEVRAVMLARLNGLLLGHTGAQLPLVERYAEFLNRRIHPVLPLKGSVGAADITNLSHIGIAFIGEGEVRVDGASMAAEAALAAAGLEPLRLGPKDGLALVSSNALSAGIGALVLCDALALLALADAVYALSLEALQGNVSPLDEAVHSVRPFPGQLQSAARVRSALAGSGLWDPRNSESLQDPLSFRDACQVHGAARDAGHYTRAQLELHLNSSDDNPCVLAEQRRVLSCANYEPVVYVLGFEMLGQALHHVSRSSCYRMLKLSAPEFTGLSRFLTPDAERSIGYSILQKTATALDAEIRHLANPASADYMSLSGDMEDHATNAPFVAAKTGEIIDRLLYVLAVEALHAAQAIDLRQGIRLGSGTAALYARVRSVVPFLAEDRNVSLDVERVYTVFKAELGETIQS
ncbi:aromatic amino acid lyase [Paenibacillaceae bacterium]|nr:aromatic amino acid lyase [Paenibacillaceae bacterium]